MAHDETINNLVRHHVECDGQTGTIDLFILVLSKKISIDEVIQDMKNNLESDLKGDIDHA